MSKATELWWKRSWSPKLTTALTHINQSRKCGARDFYEQCVELSQGINYIRDAASDSGATIDGEAKKVIESVAELLKDLSAKMTGSIATGAAAGAAGTATKENTACARAVLLLRPVIELLFDNPSHRLAVYGSLRPGQTNHYMVANIDGKWSTGIVTGAVRDIDGRPAFKWLLAGTQVPVEVLHSEQLPQNFERLDKFQEAKYTRVLVPVSFEDEIAVCNLYESVAYDQSL